MTVCNHFVHNYVHTARDIISNFIELISVENGQQDGDKCKLYVLSILVVRDLKYKILHSSMSWTNKLLIKYGSA